MIKYHPTDRLIEQFSAGVLNPALSVIISTHIDICPRCQNVTHDAEQFLAEQVMQTQVKSLTPELDQQFDQMLDQILNAEAPTNIVEFPYNEVLHLNGKTFKLPATLARQYKRIGDWSRVPGKMLKAPINLGSNECINLIYMDEGSRVPEHTHKGSEITLVINGVFNDEQDEYRDGDFVMLDQHHQHSPETRDEDCLTLATLDAPLHFTSGLARLLNPFSSLFFK